MLKMRGSLLICVLSVVASAITFSQPVKLWEISDAYKMPESAVYDAKRGVLYVSNYTNSVKDGMPYGEHTVSKAGLDGKILQQDMVKNLTTPTGICLFNDKLYIVERPGVVEYDLITQKVSNKYFIKTPGFLNDITVGADGAVYVTQSDTNIIYKISNGTVERWLVDDRISHTNGILFDAGKLLVGVNGDGVLKSIDISTKQITNLAFLGEGNIDGIAKCGNNYLVTHFVGSLYLITPSGKVTELLNTRNEKLSLADLDYAEEKELIIIPALVNSKLFGYKYKP